MFICLADACRSQTGGDERNETEISVDEARTSYSCALLRAETPLVRALELRAAQVANVSVDNVEVGLLVGVVSSCLTCTC